MNAPAMALSFLPLTLPKPRRSAASVHRPGDILNRAANDALTTPWDAGGAMEFQLLGSLEVLDEARRVEVPSGRGRSLLALLTLHAGESVAAERLVDELWGEHSPATAATVVQGLVSRLRKALEPDRTKGMRPQVLQTVGTAYRLAIDPDS